MMMGVPHQHTLSRFSDLLAPLGTREQGLPPGFFSRPSKTRAGQLAFSDKLTGARYGTAELAWKVHLERMLRTESLPTVTDLNRGKEANFAWPESLEAPAGRPVPQTNAMDEDTKGKLCTAAGALSGGNDYYCPLRWKCNLPGALSHHDSTKGTQDAAHEYSSGWGFKEDVFAELMAAPSP